MLLPMACRKDLIDIPNKVKKEIRFIFVEKIDEVFQNALEKRTRRKKTGDGAATSEETS